MRRTLLFLVAGGVTACTAGEYGIDAGPEPDATHPRGHLELTSERSLALVFGESSAIEVRYSEEGSPLPGIPIRFALEGRAHDSTLSELRVTTAEDGRARAILTAASTAAVFRVRISSERAPPIYVNVSVGNMGFGSLRVRTAYAGAREIAERTIRFYSELSCADDEVPASSDRSVTLDRLDGDEVRFTALPAGLPYAIVGRALGPSGAVLASGCIDGIGVERDRETRVTLEFRDERLLINGSYDLTLVVDASRSAESAAELALDSAAAELLASGSAPVLYLDALEAELRARGDTAAADQLVEMRRDGLLDDELAIRLADAEVDLMAALHALEAPITDYVSAFTLEGPLALESQEQVLHTEWTSPSIRFRAPEPDSPPVELPDALDVSASLSLRWSDGDVDTVEVEALQIDLPLGTLASNVLDAWANSLDHASLGLLLIEGAGCDVLAEWIDENAPLAPLCDEECAQAACIRGLDQLVHAARTALNALDASRPTIELSGEMTLLDEDVDARAETMKAELTGPWTRPGDDDPGDIVEARLTAIRIAE